MGCWSWKLHLRDILWFLIAQNFVSETIEFVGVFPDFGVKGDLGGCYTEAGSLGKSETIRESKVGAHNTVNGRCSSMSDLNLQSSTMV